MYVITPERITEFCAVHPQAKAAFESWLDVVEAAGWKNWAELRATFASADRYRSCIIFNVGGNHYRLIGWVRYPRPLHDDKWSLGRVYIRHVLTHAEYDEERWKTDCTP